MLLEPYDIKKLESMKRLYSASSNYLIIQEFLDSGLECARLKNHHYKNSNSGYTALTRSIKRFNFHGVRVVTRRGEIYLIRTDD